MPVLRWPNACTAIFAFGQMLKKWRGSGGKPGRGDLSPDCHLSVTSPTRYDAPFLLKGCKIPLSCPRVPLTNLAASSCRGPAHGRTPCGTIRTEASLSAAADLFKNDRQIHGASLSKRHFFPSVMRQTRQIPCRFHGGIPCLFLIYCKVVLSIPHWVR